ncbi:MAG: CHAT domain-containing protein, partial [Coleofasciculus sp.]|uniref:CHAT domain-containing protein n=1 Tax=Coleofasciculus sp. TaxID=3100458 RepID=UPI003A319AE4
QLSTLIDKNTAIIEWYIFDDCFRAVIITAEPPLAPPYQAGGLGGISIWTSTREDLTNLETWRDDYLNAYYAPRLAETDSETKQYQQDWQNSLPSRLNQLAEILHINDILTYIPETCTQLILIPHLYLHLFPLHALNLFPRFPDGIRYLPSCQLLHQLQQQQRPDFQRLFAIQTPTSDLYEQDIGAVSAITRQFSPIDILKKDKASKSALLSSRETLDTANSLLFFCHGYFNPGSPLDSGLQLADANLTLEDIITHFRLSNCRLVTLSACETGLTDINNISDEYISLPYGFLLAGSTNVVSSLWTVSAFATALLIVKFYQELQQQENLALALNTAQCWLRDTTVKGFQDWLPTSPFSTTWQIELKQYFQKLETEQGEKAQPFNNPYYWAAFCLIGKGV